MQFGQLNAAKVLLEFGADLEAKTAHNRTPLHLAAAQGHAEVVQHLISCKADLSARTPEGETPRDLARKYAYSHVERILEVAGST